MKRKLPSIAIALLSIGGTLVYASCSNKECDQYSCKYLGPHSSAIEYNFGTAGELFTNGGGGTPTQVKPEVGIKHRFRGYSSLECQVQVDTKTTCIGSTPPWQSTGQKKHYCKFGS